MDVDLDVRRLGVGGILVLIRGCLFERRHLEGRRECRWSLSIEMDWEGIWIHWCWFNVG